MTQVEIVYEGLCREITSGKLKPGEVLSRRRIAARYGTSYTPVIEAMVRLENVGLVESESAQVARVRRMSVEAIESDYVLREAHETQAVRLACESATDDEIDELGRLARQLDERMTESRKPDRKIQRQHWSFHKRIAELSRYRVLVRALERAELLRLLQSNWINVPHPLEPLRYHSRLVDAIRDRNPEAADAAMRIHIRNGRDSEIAGYRMSLRE